MFVKCSCNLHHGIGHEERELKIQNDFPYRSRMSTSCIVEGNRRLTDVVIFGQQ